MRLTTRREKAEKKLSAFEQRDDVVQATHHFVAAFAPEELPRERLGTAQSVHHFEAAFEPEWSPRRQPEDMSMEAQLINHIRSCELFGRPS